MGTTTQDVERLTQDELYLLLSRDPDVPGRSIWDWLSRQELLCVHAELDDPGAVDRWFVRAHEAWVRTRIQRAAKAATRGDMAKASREIVDAAKAQRALDRVRSEREERQDLAVAEAALADPENQTGTIPWEQLKPSE